MPTNGKWIPEKGLDQAVLRALFGGENGDLSGDLSAAAKVIAANSSSYECEEGDLNPHGCYPTSPSN
jgi:hypothetical protein